MADQSVADALAVLQRSPSEREQRETGPDAVRDALLTVIERGSRDQKVLTDCVLPDVAVDYETVDGENRHPVVLRDCTVGRVSAEHADVRVPVRFEDCEVGGLSLDGAYFEADVAVRDSTVTGEVSAVETRFDRDADFTNTVFEASVAMTEADFGDDTRFVDASFRADAAFRGAAFHGTSNELGDNADFSGARFAARGDFRQATFEFATFADAAFAGVAGFEEVRFDGDADFQGAGFEAEADFDEADFGEDASFADVAFEAPAVFRGALFEGGARTLQDDATFEAAAFRGPANFESAKFRQATFDDAAFDESATFEAARFDADADFLAVEFGGDADFDEARFDGDADFTGARFGALATFRGAAFEGEAQHLEENAVFADAAFDGEAAFDSATFTTANFRRTRFGDVVDFSNAAFEAVDFLAESATGEKNVDFTGARIREGAITQPEGAWVRYDLTQASVGDVALASERDGGRHELLDYFRFCNTEFDEFDGYEFDFSAHTYYFDRNDWNLHSFDDSDPDREYALPATPEHVESTYLKAKNAASAGGYVKAAGEFRVQRQRHARRKYAAIARDAGVDVASRVSSASRAAENYFLDVTCGYGMRLGRILAVFLVAPLFPALLYAFGGRAFLTGAGQLSSLSQLATPAGRAVLYENLHFSYITFLTIGYGGIGPKGALARLLAGLEVYVSVVLGGLVLYALIKRSEL
ncbi:MAG: pentapeptide repeat-containing protein [Halobacterium sp.]